MTPLTVKELKEMLEELPDDYVICYECDGPETNTKIKAETIWISNSDKTICLAKN